MTDFVSKLAENLKPKPSAIIGVSILQSGMIELCVFDKNSKISRLGGIAIWLATMMTFLCLVFLSYYPYGSLLSGILLGSSLMFLLGLVDDIYGLGAKYKLFIQIANLFFITIIPIIFSA